MVHAKNEDFGFIIVGRIVSLTLKFDLKRKSNFSFKFLQSFVVNSIQIEVNNFNVFLQFMAAQFSLIDERSVWEF